MKRIPIVAKQALVYTILLVVLAGVAVLAPGATARRTTAVVPNGTYGVFNASSGGYVIFTVRNRRVRDLNFQMQITCQASDSSSSEQRFFTGGAVAPQNRLVPANGTLTLRWQERGDGRLGHITAELKFGARDVANFAVIVPEEQSPDAAPGDALESCNGVSSMRFHRGFELPPMF